MKHRRIRTTPLALLALISCTALAQTQSPPSDRLPPPTGVEAMQSDEGVTVSWDAVEGAFSYRINNARTGAEIDETLGTTYVDGAGAVAYFITACDANLHCSAPSTRASVGEEIDDSGPIDGDPRVPAMVRYMLAADGSATLTWTPVVGAVGHHVHGSVPGSANDAFLGYVQVSADAGAMFVIENFDTSRRYRVSAFFGDAAAEPYGPKSAPAVAADDVGTDELAEALGRIAELETDLAACTALEAELGSELAESATRVDELEAELASCGTDDVATLRAELAEAEAEIDSQGALLDDAEALIVDQAEAIRELEERAADDLARIGELEDRVADLEAELAAERAGSGTTGGTTGSGTTTGGAGGATTGGSGTTTGGAGTTTGGTTGATSGGDGGTTDTDTDGSGDAPPPPPATGG